MNKKKLTLVAIVFSALFFTLGQRSVYAGVVSLNVSVDTSGLPATPGSEIVFFLTDGSATGGSATGDANNTATLSNFMFGGGSAGAVDLANIGGVTGDLSGASLTDSAFTNVFGAFFTAGSQISFILNLTAIVDPGPTPDQFGFAILDPSLTPISSTDPTTLNSLLVITLDSANPVPTSYSNLVTVTPAQVGAAPEPHTGVLAAIGSTIIAAILFFGSANKRSTAFRSL